MLRENSKFSLTPFCKRQGITVTNMINPQFFPFDVDNFKNFDNENETLIEGLKS